MIGGAVKPNPPFMTVHAVTDPPEIVAVARALPIPTYIFAVEDRFWKNRYARLVGIGHTNCDAVALAIVPKKRYRRSDTCWPLAPIRYMLAFPSFNYTHRR